MNRLKLVLVCSVLCAYMIMIGGCTKSSNTPKIPFQGPQNPSFEINADWQSEAGTANLGYFDYTTGTGFLPSQGSYYGSLTNFLFNGAASGNLNQVYIYQGWG